LYAVTSGRDATFWLLRKFLGGALSAGSRELFSAVSHHRPRRQGQSQSTATQFALQHRIVLALAPM
jgi:hypothetical protein